LRRERKFSMRAWFLLKQDSCETGPGAVTTDEQLELCAER
jgi:hypothetical protein